MLSQNDDVVSSLVPFSHLAVEVSLSDLVEVKLLLDDPLVLLGQRAHDFLLIVGVSNFDSRFGSNGSFLLVFVVRIDIIWIPVEEKSVPDVFHPGQNSFAGINIDIQFLLTEKVSVSKQQRL